MRNFFEKLYKDSKNTFFHQLKLKLEDNKKEFIVTANPETFMYGKEDREIGALLIDDRVTIVADGIGIVKSAKFFNIEINERIPGIEIAEQLLKLANSLGKSVYLFGAEQQVVLSLATKLSAEYPHLKILGYENGYVEDKDKVFETISKLQPDIILVALGIPVQEKLIYRHYEEFEKGIFVGVGGSFDVLSGIKRRSPDIFIKLNIEWLYRILKEPKRIKRFYNNNVKFFFKVKKEGKKNV